MVAQQLPTFSEEPGNLELALSAAGVGLAVSKQVVALHGGTMRARNLTEGGLEVEIRLPLAGEGQDTSTSASNA